MQVKLGVFSFCENIKIYKKGKICVSFPKEKSIKNALRR